MGNIARRFTWPAVAIFATGAVAGALLTGGAAFWMRDGHRNLRAGAGDDRVTTLPVASQPATPRETRCPDSLDIPPTHAGDGKFKLVDTITGQQPGDVRALVVVGKEAAAAQHAHDAEVAFIMACRVGTQMNADPVALADARSALAWHYASLSRGDPPVERERLAQQARALYADSLRVYTAHLGGQSEKALLVQQAVASLAEPGAVAVRPSPPTSADPPAERPALSSAAEEPRRPSSLAPAARSAVKPSFDCKKARSTPEKLICADPQLAQLDRELGGLHARAKSRAPDLAAFKRHSDDEWRRREATCRDRRCLLGWYARRRAELLEEVDAPKGDAG